MKPLNPRALSLFAGVAACAGLWVPAAPLRAQTPQSDPALTDPSNEDVLREQLRKPKDIPPVEPTKARPPQRAIPSFPTPGPREAGLDPAALPAARFYPEGALVRDRRGTLVISEQGDAILVPAPGDASPLLVLLPCQRLSQMAAARAAGGPDTRFLVSGQVFVYRDREFVIPTVFAVEHAQAPEAPAPTPVQPAAPAAASDQDPRVSDLMRDLESQRQGPRRVAAPATSKPVAAAPAVDGAAAPIDQTLRPEGTLLVSRRGRLVRLADAHGRLALVLDNDPDSPAGKPFILQPCQLLERMETIASTRGDDLVFKVSGRVSVYDGKNYLLPTFQQVAPPGDVAPMQ